jgi:hypothetical protein
VRLLRCDPAGASREACVKEESSLVLNAMAGKRPNSKGWARANCPLCELRTGKPDKKLCLGLRVDTGSWHCFRCGAEGFIFRSDMPDNLASFRSTSRVEAKAEPRGMDPLVGFIPLFGEQRDRSFSADFMREYLTGKGRTPEGERCRELPPATLQEASVGAVFEGCGRDHRAADEPICNRCLARGRIVVPIFDVDGVTWLGWSARATPGLRTLRKYVYARGMARADIMYNERALAVETDVPVFVVEGVFDVLALWPDAVAVLGKPSPEQKEALAEAKRPIVVAFDGDATREGVALARLLRHQGQRAGCVRLAAGTDPDEVPRADLDEWAARSLERGD